MTDIIVVTHRGNFKGVWSISKKRWLDTDEYHEHDNCFEGEFNDAVVNKLIKESRKP